MYRIAICAEAILAILCVGIAYKWVYELQPSDPLVPFILCGLAGGLVTDLWQRLGE